MIGAVLGWLASWVGGKMTPPDDPDEAPRRPVLLGEEALAMLAAPVKAPLTTDPRGSVATGGASDRRARARVRMGRP
jgi:hypothetical protein